MNSVQIEVCFTQNRAGNLYLIFVILTRVVFDIKAINGFFYAYYSDCAFSIPGSEFYSLFPAIDSGTFVNTKLIIKFLSATDYCG